MTNRSFIRMYKIGTKYQAVSFKCHNVVCYLLILYSKRMHWRIFMKRKTTVLLAAIFFITFSIPVLALGHGWGRGSGMMGWGYGMSWGGPIIMIIFWIAVILGIVLLIRWLIGYARGDRQGGVNVDRALEILKERYARGERSKRKSLKQREKIY